MTKAVPAEVVELDEMPLISQFVRAGTRVGSNYCEADHAVSNKEFHHKIGPARRKHVKPIAAADPTLKEEVRTLWQEAKELHLIFAAIVKKRQTVN